MKKIIFITVLITSYFISNAQIQAVMPFTKTVTPVFKDSKKTFLAFTCDDNNGGIFIGREHKDGYFLEHFNNELELINKHDLRMYKHKISTDVVGAFMIEGNLCLIERFKNFKNKSIDYFAHLSPKDSFKFKKTKLLSIKKKTLTSYNDRNNDNGYGHFLLSDNEEFFTIVFDIKNKKKEVQRFYTFDKQLNKKYQTEFIKDIKDNKFDLQDINIDKDDGSVYLLGKAYFDSKTRKEKDRKYQYELYKINENVSRGIVIDVSNKHVASLKLIQNKDLLMCVGFYSNKSEKRFAGTVLYKIDKEKMIESSKKYAPFTSQFLHDKYGKEKQKELKYLKVKKVFFTPNNEIIINAEETNFNINTVAIRALVTTQLGLIGVLATGGGYHYMDIVSVKLNSNGEVIWARNVNKNQTTPDINNYYSYISFYKNNVNYFVFNASKNLTRLDRTRIKFKTNDLNSNNLYVLGIDDTDTIKYQMIYNRKEAKVNFDIYSAIVSKDNSFVIFEGMNFRKKRLLKLSIKE